KIDCPTRSTTPTTRTGPRAAPAALDASGGGRVVSYRLLSDSATGGTLPGGVADVRGWPVREDAGALLGAVTDAVFDEFAQTRYLVVELSTSGVDDTAGTHARTARPRGGARRILLPVAMARVGAPAGEVTVPGAS